MKLAPRGGMITSLVHINGTIPPESAEGIAACEAAACAGTPVSATHDAPAAPFNNSRREILVLMIVFEPPGRDIPREPPERGALYTVSTRLARTSFRLGFSCATMIQ